MEEDIENDLNDLAGEQQSIRERRIAQLRPYQYKKGQSGNPTGRTPGVSGKERMKRKIAGMTDDEFEYFIEGINKLDLFKMGEGNPETSTDITSGGETINQVLVKFVDGKSNETTKDNTNTK